jgi:molybdopterin converting factor small subunit
MKVTVKVIGRYKDIVGKPEFDLIITTGGTMWHVIDIIIRQYPLIEKDKKTMMVTKNGIFVNLDTKISEGDHITIAPPVVSGG